MDVYGEHDMSAFVFGVVVVLVPEKGSDGVQTVDHDHQPFQPPLEPQDEIRERD